MIRYLLAVAGLVASLTTTQAVAEVRYINGYTVANQRGDVVTDGDTVRVQPHEGGTFLKIRMIGIDTPELHLPARGGSVGQHPWGDDAATALAQLIPLGTEVVVEDHGTDRYGRTLGRIYRTEDFADINYLMVRTGWALPYIYCTGAECVPGYLESEKVSDYLAACAQARTEEIGVFNAQNPLDEAPFVFRLRIQNRRPDKFVGEYSTGLLRAPHQYPEVDLCNIVFFSDEQQAQSLGFHY